jgi:hypothetical protein
MNWRRIDNMMVSKCIQYIQKEIDEDRLEPSNIIPISGLKETQALMYYKAWRVHLVDRMMEEYDRNRWNDDDAYDPTTELEDDTRYYKKVQEKDREARSEYDDE